MAALIKKYNQTMTISDELDAKFATLAAERIRRNPLRYYFLLPVERAADMWLRPRTETFDLNMYWWRWQEYPLESLGAIILGLIGIAYVAVAMLGAWRRPPPLAAFCVAYVLLRTILISTMENPEPRYTMQVFPILFVCGASFFSTRRSKEPIGADRGSLQLSV
jgi:hypothetical protein